MCVCVCFRGQEEGVSDVVAVCVTTGKEIGVSDVVAVCVTTGKEIGVYRWRVTR